MYTNKLDILAFGAHPDDVTAGEMGSYGTAESRRIEVEAAAKILGVQHRDQQEPWRPQTLYHYIQDYSNEPDFVIDITEQMDQKMEAILAFKSQFVHPEDPSMQHMPEGLQQTYTLV